MKLPLTTLAAIWKLKLAETLMKEALPSNRVSDQEIERRTKEVLSGKVKGISATESKARIYRLMTKIKRVT